MRDLRLDSFRGLALVVMTIDHLCGSFKGITYQLFGFVTAAELFVFLSGLVAGMVYSRRMKTHSYTEVRTMCWKRAGLLYVYHIVTILAVIAVASLCDPLLDSWRAWIPHYRKALLFEAPAKALGLTAILVYQPTHLDILPMYALFLIVLPWVLRLLNRKVGLVILLALTLGLWLSVQNVHSKQWLSGLYRPLGFRPPYFELLAWQCLFFLGLLCGKARVDTEKNRWLTELVRWGWLPALLLSFAMLLLRYDVISSRWVLTLFDLRAGTSISHLGWFRLLNFLCLVLAVAGPANRWPHFFQWRWLSLLGQHSLQVYTAHLAILFLLAPVWMRLRKLGLVQELAWTMLTLALLTAAAWGHQRWQHYRQQRNG